MNSAAPTRVTDRVDKASPIAKPPRAFWRWLPPLPGFLLLLVLTLPPLAYGLYLSLVNVDIAAPNRPVHFVGLDNFREVVFTSAGLSAITNTLVLSFGSVWSSLI